MLRDWCTWDDDYNRIVQDVRGALVKLLSLTEPERQRGVIAMSAGNHAQAVAYHAQQLGIPAIALFPVVGLAGKSDDAAEGCQRQYVGLLRIQQQPQNQSNDQTNDC